MKITAFAASTSKKSINLQLVKHVLKSFTEDDIHLLDLNDYDMPVFSVDREAEGFPPQVQHFLDAIAPADLLIISMTEHNGATSAAFKNIFDWTSRKMEKLFQDKPIFLLSTSPGRNGAQLSLEYAKTRFPKHGGTIVDFFSLPSFNHNFDPEKGITEESLHAQLNEKTAKVKEIMKG